MSKKFLNRKTFLESLKKSDSLCSFLKTLQSGTLMLFTSLAVSRREKGIYWVIDEFKGKELAWNQVEAFSRNCFMVAFSHLQTDETELFLQIALYKDLRI